VEKSEGWFKRGLYRNFMKLSFN